MSAGEVHWRERGLSREAPQGIASADDLVAALMEAESPLRDGCAAISFDISY
jgi:hypothetical protein